MSKFLEKMRENWNNFKTNIKKSPGTAIAAVFGIGIVVTGIIAASVLSFGIAPSLVVIVAGASLFVGGIMNYFRHNKTTQTHKNLNIIKSLYGENPPKNHTENDMEMKIIRKNSHKKSGVNSSFIQNHARTLINHTPPEQHKPNQSSAKKQDGNERFKENSPF